MKSKPVFSLNQMPIMNHFAFLSEYGKLSEEFKKINSVLCAFINLRFR
jgi:hypothetical protein